jgi:hypothetical protein
LLTHCRAQAELQFAVHVLGRLGHLGHRLPHVEEAPYRRQVQPQPHLVASEYFLPAHFGDL